MALVQSLHHPKFPIPRIGLIPSIEKLFPNECAADVVFYRGNAPAHIAKPTKLYLMHNSIKTRFYPEQSVDLNTIENLTYTEGNVNAIF